LDSILTKLCWLMLASEKGTRKMTEGFTTVNQASESSVCSNYSHVRDLSFINRVGHSDGKRSRLFGNPTYLLLD